MKFAAKMSRRAKVIVLAAALTLVAGSAALATPDMGTPFDRDVPTGSATSSTYRDTSVVGPGLKLGDGTFEISVSCEAGDRVLSG